MKVFLWEEKQFFEVNRKEELDDNTFIISDFEQEKITESLENDGYLWIDNGDIKFSGAKPDAISNWDDIAKVWYIDEDLKNALISEHQDRAWNKIKLKRTELITGGVYINEIDKRIHTDTESLAMYSQIGTAISLGTFKELNWKAMDNTFFIMDVDTFKIIQSKIMEFTQTIFHYGEIHKQTMMELENPLKYDCSDGWGI